MEFSEDQRQARDTIATRLRAAGIDIDSGGHGPPPREGPASVLAVLGKAGSGKTALLVNIAAALEAAGLEPIGGDYEPRRTRARRSYAVLAPTNKAASVLRARKVQATTLHRILYIPVYDPEFEKIAKWLTAADAPRPNVEGLDDALLDRIREFYDMHGSVPGALAIAGLSGSDFITGWTRRDEPLDVALVDEASMLDQRQLDDLKEVFSTLILFGDPAQLAPVGQSGAMVFEALDEASKPMLSRIHRQSADNPILDLAHALRDGIDFDDFEREIERAAAKDERIVVAPRVDPDLMARAPILVWRNATRLRLIQAFRTVHDAPEAALLPGEPLICDGIELPLKHRKKRIDLEARGLIKGAQAIYLGPGKRKGFARLHVAGAEAPTISAAAIIKIEAPDREEPIIASAARMGAVFVHGAATTIHKAQGSQWPAVQIFAPDIYAAARSGRMEAGAPLWRRLAYVAATRAEERLIWVARYRMARPARALGVADLG
ncbi:ATP-dependent DNA helicase [Pikeienuella sp. HZG-20]|uniref:ATP-dependent DNA helicase n=1 Tax=Paludibacillus litoralis TaxID=3133267 RepID=UPI0030EB8830